MGLCKCPKRKVTNLFCYVHRVNVCEYCLVANHPKCVVQSYLNWLKDSDFDNCCTLSGREFESVDTVRLLCYCKSEKFLYETFLTQNDPNHEI